MDINESDPTEHYTINNRVHLNFKIMGKQKLVHAITSVSLDMMYSLQKFSFSLSSEGPNISINGVRAGEHTFDVEVSTGTSIERMMIEIPDDVVIYSPVAEIAMKQLRPDQQIIIRTLDPVTLRKANVVIRALRKEPIVLAGEKYKATVLATKYQDIEILTWMDSDGNVLRQEAPFGLVMEKCTFKEAFAAVQDTGKSDDILKAMALKFFSMDM